MNSSATARRRRSVLFVPACNPRALDKARALGCDALILDLEDSAAPEAKETARRAALAALAQGFGGRETVVRCNGLDTPWGAADLEALKGAGAEAVLVPKVRSAAELLAVRGALGSETALWAMIETPEAVLNLAGIAAAPGLEALALGPNDLALELRLRGGGRAALRPILTQLVVAARAHGLAALGGAFDGLDDAAGFEAECREEAGFGLDGKTLVHPGQIEAANRIFSPTPEELAWAEAVTAAFAAPEAQGQGAIRLQGRMIERLHLAAAERTLALARG